MIKDKEKEIVNKNKEIQDEEEKIEKRDREIGETKEKLREEREEKSRGSSSAQGQKKEELKINMKNSTSTKSTLLQTLGIFPRGNDGTSN